MRCTASSSRGDGGLGSRAEDFFAPNSQLDLPVPWLKLSKAAGEGETGWTQGKERQGAHLRRRACPPSASPDPPASPQSPEPVGRRDLTRPPRMRATPSPSTSPSRATSGLLRPGHSMLPPRAAPPRQQCLAAPATRRRSSRRPGGARCPVGARCAGRGAARRNQQGGALRHGEGDRKHTRRVEL
jgi:hypothetical protein